MQTVLATLINALPEYVHNSELNKIVSAIKTETNMEKQLKMILENKGQIKAILLHQQTK